MTRKEKDLNYKFVVDASKEFVWNARANPDLVPRYFRTDRILTKSYTADFREGGKSRAVIIDSEGEETIIEALFTEIKPYSRLKYEVKPYILLMDPYVVEESVEDHDGGTLYNVDFNFRKKEDLCSLIDFGWHIFFLESFARFRSLVNDMSVRDTAAK